MPYTSSREGLGRADRSLLEKQCQAFLLNGLAPSTRRSYASAQRRFIDFCSQLGRSSPCPADEQVLCLFITHLARTIQHRSIKVYLSGVRSLHIERGFADPLEGCLRLQQVLRGIKRVQGTPASQRLPITDALLIIIHKALVFDSYNHRMFWAACTLAYFGLLRSAEFTVPNLGSFDSLIHLQVSDLAFDNLLNPSCLRVLIKASKTDPFRKGCHIHIGRGNLPLCAVSAMSCYLHSRGGAPGPLFLLEDGRPLSRQLLTSWLRDIFSGAGVSGNYSSHSFRIGAASVAARNGVPDHLIQAVGRWTSNAYLAYIRTPVDALAAVSRHLC